MDEFIKGGKEEAKALVKPGLLKLMIFLIYQPV